MEYAPVHEGFSQLMPLSSGMGDGRDDEVQRRWIQLQPHPIDDGSQVLA